MNFRKLLRDDDAVSPVIGVILMVAITVILAAVIGTFVLGLGDQVSQSQPSANIGFSYDNISDTNDYNDRINITHKGGDKLDASSLKVTVGSYTVFENGKLDGNPDDDTGDFDLKVPDPDGNLPSVQDNKNQTAPNAWTDSSITAGDQLSIFEAQDSHAVNTQTDIIQNGDTVSIIWSADNGDTAIIAEGTVQ